MKTVDELWNALEEAKSRGDSEEYNLYADTLATYGSSLFRPLLHCFSSLRSDLSRDMALDVVSRMKEDSKQALLWKLTYNYLDERSGPLLCLAFIDALPRDWVEEHIEATVRPLLDDDDWFAYYQLLALLSVVSEEICLKIAKEASQSANPPIREEGLEYLFPKNET